MADEMDPLDPSPRARLRRFLSGIINSRFLFVAFILHIIFFVIFGSVVLFKGMEKNTAFNSEQFLISPPAGISLPPLRLPQKENTEDNPVKKIPSTAIANPQKRIRTQDMPMDGMNAVPPDNLPDVIPNMDILSLNDAFQKKIDEAEGQRLDKIHRFFQQGVTHGPGQPGPKGHDTSLLAEFTCYVGQYQGGDWDCNLGILTSSPLSKEGKWYGNCICNLMLQIKRWTKGNIKANVKPEFLKFSDREWIDMVKPPFIFITGHKDFKFTPAEIENLREYLMLGGCLWVDNSLPGKRSRFDIALRREMKKVLSQDFEQIKDPRHPIFNSYYHLKELPAGVNYYHEPIEVIKIGGDVAVIYTLNAYSNLWQTALTEADQPDDSQVWIPEQQEWLNRSGPLWVHNYIGGTGYPFFRNVTKESVKASYQLGLNIVAYLLTRFQGRFLILSPSA